MSPQEIQQLKALIVATSLYYGQQIHDDVLALYVEDLADLPFAGLVDAIRAVRRNPKTTRFPLPAVLREQLQPTSSPEGYGREIAARIVGALARYGYTNEARARAYIGELGWEIVGMQGGWLRLCEDVKSSQVPTYQAQLRELAIEMVRRDPEAAGVALPMPESVPSIQYHQRSEEGEAFKRVMGQLEDMKRQDGGAP